MANANANAMTSRPNEPEYPWLGRWEVWMLRVLVVVRSAASVLLIVMFLLGLAFVLTAAGLVSGQWVAQVVGPHAGTITGFVGKLFDAFSSAGFYLSFGFLVFVGVMMGREAAVRRHFLDNAPTPPRLHRRLAEVFPDMSRTEVDALVREVVRLWISMVAFEPVHRSAVHMRVRKALYVWAEDPASLRRWHWYAYAYNVNRPRGRSIGDTTAFFEAFNAALASGGQS
jgi:hypothetical protein